MMTAGASETICLFSWGCVFPFLQLLSPRMLPSRFFSLDKQPATKKLKQTHSVQQEEQEQEQEELPTQLFKYTNTNEERLPTKTRLAHFRNSSSVTPHQKKELPPRRTSEPKSLPNLLLLSNGNSLKAYGSLEQNSPSPITIQDVTIVQTHPTTTATMMTMIVIMRKRTSVEIKRIKIGRTNSHSWSSNGPSSRSSIPTWSYSWKLDTRFGSLELMQSLHLKSSQSDIWQYPGESRPSFPRRVSIYISVE